MTAGTDPEGSREPAPWPPVTPAWPPPPAAGGGWEPSPWDPPPGPRRGGRLTLVAALVTGVALVAAGAAVGAGIAWRSSAGPAADGPAPTSLPGAAGPPVSAGVARVEAGVVDVTAALLDPAGEAAGTGMVLTSSGEVLTNNHVIDGATHVRIEVGDTGRTYAARVIGTDAADDIALLQVENASGLTTVPLGESSSVRVGDAVTAVGNALGRGGPPTVTQGVVVALGRAITAGDGLGNAETLTGMIQTNAQIQPGDSGGALSDSRGRVVGMITAAAGGRRFSRGAASSVGFAIPIDTARSVATQIAAGRSPGGASGGGRALFGVVAQDDGSGSGAEIAQISPGSPAASAGLAAGDRVVEAAGVPIGSAAALRVAVESHRPGDRIVVTWITSSGMQRSATVQLAAG